MASGVGVMEKPIHQLQQQRQQQPLQSQEAGLKCPRCDSANTKFCYYNNYSLSQPRHFCKACKRYWTRGGTLRNVPVGGGCRKNKRVKRPPITTSTTVVHHVPVPPSAINHQTNPNPNPNPNQIPSSTTCTSSINSLFYGLLPQNPNYPRFNTPVSSISETGALVVSGYDHLLDQVLPARHINASGLGFSGTVLDVAAANHGHNSCSNLTSFSSYNNNNSPAAPMYGTGGGGSTSSSSSAPTTMASLLASSLNHQQQIRFMGGFASYDGSMVKDQLKIEQINRNMDEWNNHHHHQMESAVDPNNSLLWDNNDEEGVWVDPTNNIGSTVPSLI